MFFYAVGKGRKIGVFATWDECKKYVLNFNGAKFKKFSTKAEAWNFVDRYSNEIVVNTDKVSVGQTVTTEEPKLLLSEIPLKVQTLEDAHAKAMDNIDEIKRYLQCLETYLINIKEKGSEVVKNVNDSQVCIKNLQRMEHEYEYYSIEFGKIIDYIKSDDEHKLSYNCTYSSCSKEMKDSANLKSLQIPSTSTGKSSRKRKRGTESVFYRGDNDHKRMKCTNFNISPTTGFITNADGFVEVYTDGACENNGKFGAKAGIGVWFGENHSLNISKPVDGRATNNMAEIQAASEAVNVAKKAGVNKLLIHTDSKFLIQCMTEWIQKWKINNWQSSTGQPVKNKDELLVLDYAIKGMHIKWNHVRAHCGILGNERADELARNGAQRYTTNNSYITSL